MYMCVWGVDFVFFDWILEPFQQCAIFWNRSNSVLYFRTVPTVCYILEPFQQCAIFRNRSNSVLYFRTVPTVCYILFCISFYYLSLLVRFAFQEWKVLPEHLSSPRFTIEVHVAQSLVFCAVVCQPFFVFFVFFLFGLCIVHPSSNFTSDYPFGIFKLFSVNMVSISSENSLKVKMRRFFKNPRLNSLVLRRQWRCKKSEYKLQSRA